MIFFFPSHLVSLLRFTALKLQESFPPPPYRKLETNRFLAGTTERFILCLSLPRLQKASNQSRGLLCLRGNILPVQLVVQGQNG